jgi:hypothetical protein
LPLHFTPRFLHSAGISLMPRQRHTILASIQPIFWPNEVEQFHGNDSGNGQGPKRPDARLN